MASATRTPVPVPPPTEIVLTLTEKEAKTLRAVCAHIGGGGHTPRGDMDNIAFALESVGVFTPEVFVTTERAIYFDDKRY